MDSLGAQIPTLDWDSTNLPEAWGRFRQHVELMFEGPLAGKTEEIKCKYLLLWSGERGREVYNSWALDADQKKSLALLYQKFGEHIQPKANPIFVRYRFHCRTQAMDEPVENFVTDLRVLARDCAFPNVEEMVRDRIVFGTNSKTVREKLLSEGAGLTLDKAISTARNLEYAKQQLREMETSASASGSTAEKIHYLKRKPQKTATATPKPSKPGKEKMIDECKYCGQSHPYDRKKCPAFGQKCPKCGGADHFSVKCTTKPKFKGYKQKKGKV